MFDNFDPMDPRRYGLMQMALALMANQSPKLGQAVGNAGLMGLQGYQQQRAFNSREADANLDRTYRRGLLEDQGRQRADAQRISDIYSQNTMPGNLAPNDDEGNPMPPAPQVLNLQGLQQGLMGAGPSGLREAAAIQGLMQKQQPKYHNVNGNLVPEPQMPGQKVEPVYQAPREQWEDAGKDPRTGQALQKNTLTGQLRAVGGVAPQVNVNTNMPPLEKREQGDKGALNVKNYEMIQGNAASARKENAILSGLEKIDLDTGKTTPANTTVNAWIGSLGGGQRFKEVAAKGQSFTGFATELVLQKQLAQKGPQTESDARRLEQTVANLGNETEANRLLVTFSKAVNDRSIKQDEFYRDWWRKHKTYEGADDAWFAGEGGKSIWDDERFKRFQGPKGSGKVLYFDSQGNPK